MVSLKITVQRWDVVNISTSSQWFEAWYEDNVHAQKRLIMRLFLDLERQGNECN